MPPAAESFRVLFVCTGNICRSAVAERLLRRELADRLGDDARLVLVESAGVQGLVGEPMDPDAAAALGDVGGDPTGFTARRIDARDVREADLVLTANRKHRATVVRLEPTSIRRTFTMREFASLADRVDLTALDDETPGDRMRRGVEEAAISRGTVRPDDRHDLDIADPYRAPAAVHRRTVRTIGEVTAVAAGLLAAAANPERAMARSIEERAERAGTPASPAGGDVPKDHHPPRHGRRWPLLLGLGAAVLIVLGAGGWLTWTGLSAKHELEAAQPLVRQVRAAVVDGEPARARSAARALRRHTSTARARTGGPVWSVAAHLPILGDDIGAVRTMARAVDDVAQDVLPPLIGVAGSVRPASLRETGNRIDLAPLQAAAPTLRASATRSRRVQTAVLAVPSAGLVGPVNTAMHDLRGNLAELVTTTASAARAAELIPPMLGAEGPRRYFLAFQNNAESRGTGGLLGAYGVLEADHGRVRVVRLGPNTDLPNPKRLPVDLGPDYRRLYGRTPPLWVNGNVSPHFPYAGRIWTAMWQQQFGQQLDGVIATDPVALGYLLRATGPATVPGGGQINATNAASLTMQKVYDHYPKAAENAVRDAYLQAVAGAVFEKVLSGEGDARALVDQLAKAADQRRLLVYSTHPDEQRKLEQTELAGALPRDSRPFAGLVLNNYSGNKLDYYLDRSLTYTRSRCPTSGARTPSKITVTLTNHAPAGLPPYVDQRLDVASFAGRPPKGASTSLVQIYASTGADLTGATVDGKPQLVTAGTEQGKAVFEFNLTVLRGQTRTVVLDLTEPGNPGRARVLAQPLVRPMSSRSIRTGCDDEPSHG